MKKLFLKILLFILFANFANSEEIKHCFIAVDNGSNRLWYIDQFDSAKNWSVATDKKPRDIRLSPDGKTLLISVDKGAVEYEVATGKRTGFEISNFKGIQSAQKLDDGNYLLATANKIFICDSKGKEIKNIPIGKGSKPYIRIVTLTQKQTLLYTAVKPFCINEVDMGGKVLRTIKIPDKGYKVKPLKNGNYLTSSGDSVSVFEVTSKGEVVKTYGGKKNHPKLNLTFNSGWHKLKNGNIVATCWHGHGYKGNGPHLVEYTPENIAIWTWYNKDVKQVTNILILK